MFTCLSLYLSKKPMKPLPNFNKFYRIELSSLWNYREFHKTCRMSRRTRSYLCSMQKIAEMEFICTQQIHMIERCYEHFRYGKSFDQSLQLVRHLRIKSQHTNSLKPVFVSSIACGITCFCSVSLSSFTYLPQSC